MHHLEFSQHCCTHYRNLYHLLTTYTIDQVLKWTYSKHFLAWLNELRVKWKNFITNKITEIHNLYIGAKWKKCLVYKVHYVPSGGNPTDLVSRDMRKIIGLTVNWWNEPKWLAKGEGYWPANENICEKIPNAKLVAINGIH